MTGGWKRARALTGLAGGGLMMLFTCSASPSPSPSPVVVNVKQTAVGINVCHSGCVQNVNVQNISVVIVNQGQQPPVRATAQHPTPAAAAPAVHRKPTYRPHPTSPSVQPASAQSGPGPADPPAVLTPWEQRLQRMEEGPTSARGAAASSTGPETVASRPAAALSRPRGPDAAPDPRIPLAEIGTLALVLLAWISLFFVRRPPPPSGLLVLDDGIPS